MELIVALYLVLLQTGGSDGAQNYSLSNCFLSTCDLALSPGREAQFVKLKFVEIIFFLSEIWP